ncbi:hypothetical protein QFZ33_002442 [Arthrobacter globiformis]|nr:hypothetical protein [Arthrobacter globiformis]
MNSTITIDIPYWELQVLYAYQGEAHPNLTHPRCRS